MRLWRVLTSLALIGILAGLLPVLARAADRPGDDHLNAVLASLKTAEAATKDDAVRADLLQIRDATSFALKTHARGKEAMGSMEGARERLRSLAKNSGGEGKEFQVAVASALESVEAYLEPPPLPMNTPTKVPRVPVEPRLPKIPRLDRPRDPRSEVPQIPPSDSSFRYAPGPIAEGAVHVDCVHFAQDDRAIYLLWRELSADDLEGAIRLATSVDGGAFGAPTTVHTFHVSSDHWTQRSRSPRICAGGGVVWVSWLEGLQFLVLESRDLGRTFPDAPLSLTVSGLDHIESDVQGRDEFAYADGGLVVVSTESDPATGRIQVFARRIETSPEDRRGLAARAADARVWALGRRDLANARATVRSHGSLVHVAFHEMLRIAERANLMLSESRDASRTWRTIAAGEGRSGLNPDPIHNSAVGDRAKCLGPSAYMSTYPQHIQPDCVGPDLETVLHMPTIDPFETALTYPADPTIGFFGGAARVLRFTWDADQGSPAHAAEDSSERRGRTETRRLLIYPLAQQMAGNRMFWMEALWGHQLRIFSARVGERGRPASDESMPQMHRLLALAVGDGHIVIVLNGDQALWRRIRDGEPVGAWNRLSAEGGPVDRFSAISLGSSFVVAWHEGTTIRTRRINW